MITSIFTNLLFNNVTSVPFTPSSEALTAFAKYPDTLSQSYKVALNRWINKMVAKGHYSGALDNLVICAGPGSAPNGLIDIAPVVTNHNGTRAFIGAGAVPTWANTTGFTTNGNNAGTGNYINMNFNPSTHFVNASDTDHCVFVFIKGRSTAAGSVGTLFGAVGTTSTRQESIVQSAAAVSYKAGTSATNSSTYWTEVMPNSAHFLTRAGTAVRYGYNGQRVIEAASTSGGSTNVSMFVGGRNNNGTPDTFLGCEILCYGVYKRSVVYNPKFWIDMETFFMEIGVITQSSTYGLTTGSSSSSEAIVSISQGQSLMAGHNINSAAASDLTGVLDGRVGWRSSLGGAFSIQSLQIGVNNNFENTGNYSQELRLAKEISAYHPGGRYVQAKYAIGGSSMFDGANSWFVGGVGTLTAEGRSNFTHPTLAALVSEGKTLRIKMYEFYQGQTDAGGNAGNNPLWKENFSAKLKADIDAMEALGYNLTGMWVVVHRILNRYVPTRDFANAVRADQDAMPTYFFAQNPTYVSKIAGIIVNNNDDLINDSDTIHDTPDAVEVRALRTARFLLSKL